MLKPNFTAGDPVPRFTVRATGNPEYQFDTVAGRHIVLLFLGSAAVSPAAAVHRAVMARRELFDDERVSLFITTIDPADERQDRLQPSLPGVRVFWDLDAAVSRRFGVAVANPEAPGGASFTVAALVLDPCLHVMRWFVGTPERPDFSAALLDFVAALPAPLVGEALPQAPVLLLPRVFEPDFCQALVAYYERTGGSDSGYMKSEGGVIRGVIDHARKRRFDCLIEDETLRQAIAYRIRTRLNPALLMAFRFHATRMERYLVACYDAQGGGYFRPHRDNDGDGHRQFAVTINLNAEAYEGGDLRFPEFGRQTYRAPTGGACIFACSLMHEATPVTRGRRFAFLPFLYDEAAAQQREANNRKYVDPAVHYRYEPASKAPGAAPAEPV